MKEKNIKVTESKETVSTFDNILRALKLRFLVRYNTRTNEFEVFDRRYHLKGWQVRNSRIDNSIFLHLKKLSCGQVSKQDIDLLFTSEVEEYNDIVEYFSSISWQPNERDYIQELGNTVQCEDQEYWFSEFKNWLVLMVGTMLNTDKDIVEGTTTVNSTILTFIGKGGIGKTYWFNNLLPYQLRKYLKNGFSDLRTKDANIALSRYALIKVDEIDTLSKQDKEKLAKIATDYSIEERIAYEKYDSKLVRIASFCATTNCDDFLISGAQSNRRYSIHRVKSLNAEHGIDLDKVFAQAYYMFKNNEYINSQEYHSSRYDIVKEYEQTDLDFEMLSNTFVECELKDNENWITASEVYQILRSKGYTFSKDNTLSIGRLLTRLIKNPKNKKKTNGNIKYHLKQIR